MKNKSEKSDIFARIFYIFGFILNRLFYVFISLLVIYLIEEFVFKSLDIAIPFNNFFWWLIILVNFTGYFLKMFGWKQEIKITGQAFIIISFVWMWLQFSFGQFLILFPIYFLTKTIADVIMILIISSDKFNSSIKEKAQRREKSRWIIKKAEKRIWSAREGEWIFKRIKELTQEEYPNLEKWLKDEPEDFIESIKQNVFINIEKDIKTETEDFFEEIKNLYLTEEMKIALDRLENDKKEGITRFEGLSEEISFDGQNTILFGVKLTKYPIIEEKLLSNPEVVYMKVQEVSEKYHNNNYETAISMIEMDLTPLSEEKREQWWNR